MASRFDAVIIGSGMGGLAAAAALAVHGKRVLVLERHTQAGGLSQTFERDGFRFSVGMQPLGDFGEGQLNRRLFDALAGGRIAMAPVPGVYHRIHFPDFSIAFTPPAGHLKATLMDAFPQERAGIEAYFQALRDAERALDALFVTHSAPALIAAPLAWLRRESIERWVGRSTLEVVQQCVGDPRLQALLCAQWGEYGSRPSVGSFAAHAALTAHWFDGAWVPVGGSGAFAREFGRTVTEAGGEIRTSAEVVAIGVADGRATGVTLAGGERIDCPCVISDAGIGNTLRLLPSSEIDYGWAADALDLEPGVGYAVLYLGLEGDIAAHGADTATCWFFDGWDADALWTDPAAQDVPPVLSVSFPSLRDPAHEPGPRLRHTAEVVALVDWSAFAQWDRSDDGMKKGAPAALRSDSYAAFKAMLEARLRAQFARRFPALAKMIVAAECSTPISVATYTGAPHGAMYGLQTSPRRFLSNALRPRTPVGGLLLAGQDACAPGLTGAMMGGLMAAASADPRVWALVK